MFKLCCISLLMAVVWLVGLPMLARWAPVANHIDRMNAKDINVGARFYSELNWDPPDGATFR
jgi:hypothetical protein